MKVASATVCKEGAEPPRLAVIAMGKCGARELNYVSDVDVIFVGEYADSVSTRVAGGEMIRLASDTFFEVDAACVRKASSALVRTLESHLAYYQRWAKTWEFQALLKARPAVGDAELGKQYMAAIMPMVWSACEREDFVPEVQAMRRRWRRWCLRISATARSSSGRAGCATSNSRSSSCNWCTGAPTSRCTSPRRFLRWRHWRPELCRARRCGQLDRIVRIPAAAGASAAIAAPEANSHVAAAGRRGVAAIVRTD